MRILATAFVAAMAATTAMADTLIVSEAPAPILSGEVSLDFAETANENYGGTMGVELDINAGEIATVDLGFKATDGNALTLDTWTVGTEVNGLGLAFGDDNGVMPEAEKSAYSTLATPAMTESLALSIGDATVAIGLTDWTADVSDLSNVQGAYSFNMNMIDVTAMLDYNLDSENTVLGAEVEGLDLGMVALGGVMTYDTDAESIGYEGNANVNGITAYVNGDDANKLQHVGAEVERTFAEATWTAGVNYDTDAEEFAPTAGVSFNF